MGRGVLANLIACLSLSLGASAFAQPTQHQYAFDIAQLPLVLALKEFSHQTGLQIGYLPNSPEEEKTLVGPVKGRHTAEFALTELLKPSRLSFEWVNARTISVTTPWLMDPPSTGIGVGESVAGKDRPRAKLSDDQQRIMAAGGGLSGSSRGPLIDSILVTGTRLGDIFETEAPVTVFERKMIDQLGVSTVVDLLKYMPQQPYVRDQGYREDGAQYAELRGLGVDTTLVLINGRRTLPTATNLGANGWDLNSIPLQAVERVEVLSDSASAVYGADAVGGVINIILKKHIAEPRADFSYGAADGGGAERQASMTFGDWTGRLRGSVVLDYFSRDDLLGFERDRWRNQDYRRFGSVDWRSPIASPGNVSSALPGNLPGLPSPFAAVPRGSSGIGLTPADFLPTAGQYNLESPYSTVAIFPESEHRSGVAQGEVDIGPELVAFAELLHVNGRVSTQLRPPALERALVPVSNPFNPFRVPVLVDLSLKGMPPKIVVYEMESSRAVAGLRGEGKDWAWELSLLRSEENSISYLVNYMDPTRVSVALAASDPDQALNVFQDGPGGSPQLLASLLAEPRASHYSSDGMQAVGYVRGPLFSMPAGQANVVIGAEWRNEDLLYDLVERFPLPALFGSHHRRVASGFAEMRLPLASPVAGLPAMRELALLVAARLDNYGDVGSTFNPQYSMIWSPIEGLSVRGSFATGFRAPSLFELFAPKIPVVAPIADARRNNEVTSTTIVGGGNQDLRPTRAESVTAHIVLEPRALPDLRLEASYWRIEMVDRVSLFAWPYMLANEARFADRISRAEPTSADIAAGIPGPLKVIDISRLNSGSLKTCGIDFNAAYAWQMGLGTLIPTISATWIGKFQTADLPGGATTDRINVAHIAGTIPRWRAVAGLNWEGRSGIAVSATARYTPSYDDSDPITRRRTGRKVRSQTLIDAQVSVDLGALLHGGIPGSGFEIRAGVLNLFDTEPPFSESGMQAGYDLSQGDLKQRFSYVRLSKSF